MRQFGYEQTIPRDPTVSAPIAMTRRQLDEVFAYREHHMVPEEARATLAEHVWSCFEWYISWYYRVSHPYMLPAAEGGPSRPAHKEILRAHQAQLDHTQDLLPRCHQIADRGLGTIVEGLITEGTPYSRVLDDMIRLAESAYRRHRARTRGTLDARGRASRALGGRGGGGRGDVQDDTRHTQY
ncbi:uncharacterized protein LOC131598007 [Vicia villosa]|uniref:uncharacterized protein LOC131598007 n=1 Tax=Vicia villosa TaxID=3911 RepID=UPI00273CA342|nr:uncharacterized protein LOC131598007 [Vicia villosa]